MRKNLSKNKMKLCVNYLIKIKNLFSQERKKVLSLYS